MSIRKSALLVACLSFSVFNFACSDESIQGVFEEIVACDPAKEPSVCDGNNMKVCAITKWETVICPETCDNGKCTIPTGAECAVTVCADDKVTLNKCENGQLIPQKCADNEECLVNACTIKASTEPKDCEPGEVKCSEDGSGTQTCTVDGVWGAVKACDEGLKCDAQTKECVPEAEAAECENEKIQCTDGSNFKTCVEGKWSETTTACAAETPVCNKDKCEAKADTPECKAECDGSNIKNCKDGVLGEAESCGENKVCSDDGSGAKCVDAAPDANICIDGSAPSCVDGTHSKSCVNGTWNVKTCDEKEECNQTTGLCVTKAACQKGQIQCTTALHLPGSVDKYVECGDDGNWGTEEKSCAAETPVCDGDITPVKCVAECTNDSKRCSVDGKLQTCRLGAWSDNLLDGCSAQETCSDGKCVCTQGTTSCNSDRSGFVACKADGSWDTTVTACTYGCSAETGKCHECSGNAAQCLDNGDFQICENNKWKTVTNCGSKDQCNAGEGTLGCKCEKAAQYVGDIKLNDGDLKCDANKANIMECTRKTYNLVNAYNAWENNMDCGGANKCAERNGTYICACESNAWRCDGQSLQKCTNGAWQEDKLCPETDTCDAAKSACICNEGAYKCTGNILNGNQERQKCSSGEWVSADACTGDMTCNDTLGGVCVNAVCTNINIMGSSIAETMCYNNSVMECADGNFIVKENCGTKVCQETPVNFGSISYTQAECKNAEDTSCSFLTAGQKRCSADGQTIEVCKREGGSYKYITDKPCDANSRCKAEGSEYSCEIKVCNELETSCAGDKVVMCLSNAPKEIADCASAGMKCKDGACILP